MVFYIGFNSVLLIVIPLVLLVKLVMIIQLISKVLIIYQQP